MKITVIGHWGAYPEANQATSGYLVQTEETNILLDCGSGVLSKVQSYIDLSQLDAVILSHYHADHIADIYSLQYGIMIASKSGQRQEPLFIYGHAQDEKFQSLAYKSYCVAQSIAPNQSLTIGDLKLSFSKNVHPGPLSLATKVEDANGKKFIYSGDTEWSQELVNLAQEGDLFICEASLYNEQRGQIFGHLTGGETGEIAMKANVRRLVLTHLPHYGDHQQLLREAEAYYKGHLELADQDKSWTL